MTDEKKMSCVVVTLQDGNLRVTRCLSAASGEYDSFSPDVPLAEVKRSLGVKVDDVTIARLCEMWTEIGTHLQQNGGRVFVRAHQVEVSQPPGMILAKPMARSAAHS